MDSQILKQRMGRLQEELAETREALRDELVRESGIMLGSTIIEADGKQYLVTKARLWDGFRDVFIKWRGYQLKKDGTPGILERDIYSYHNNIKIIK